MWLTTLLHLSFECIFFWTQRRKRCGVIDSDSDDDEAEHCNGQLDENVLPATSAEDTTVEPSLKVCIILYFLIVAILMQYFNTYYQQKWD